MKMIYITKWTPLHVYLIICRTGFTQNVAINKTKGEMYIVYTGID